MDLIQDIAVNLLSDGISFLLGTIFASLFFSSKKAEKVIQYITDSLFKKNIVLGK